MLGFNLPTIGEMRPTVLRIWRTEIGPVCKPLSVDFDTFLKMKTITFYHCFSSILRSIHYRLWNMSSQSLGLWKTCENPSQPETVSQTGRRRQATSLFVRTSKTKLPSSGLPESASISHIKLTPTFYRLHWTKPIPFTLPLPLPLPNNMGTGTAPLCCLPRAWKILS